MQTFGYMISMCIEYVFMGVYVHLCICVDIEIIKTLLIFQTHSTVTSKS